MIKPYKVYSSCLKRPLYNDHFKMSNHTCSSKKSRLKPLLTLRFFRFREHDYSFQTTRSKTAFSNTTSIAIFLCSMLLCVTLYANGTQNLKTLLQSFKSFSANFSQETGPGTQKQSAHGKLVILKPNQFWWHATSPNEQYYISDGKILWNYQVDLQQVIKSRLSIKIATTPLALLSGKVTDINQLFSVSQPKPGYFSLTPKSQSSLLKTISLSFVDNKLSAMKLVNHLDQVTDIRFSQVKINTKIDQSLFQFSPPKGVDVISQ